MNLETDKWESAGVLSSSRSGHYYWISGGKIWIAGGSATLGGDPLSSIEIYDPASNSWEVSGKFF